jgi:hypothetical protein
VSGENDFVRNLIFTVPLSKQLWTRLSVSFLIGIVVAGVKLGPLGTAATDRPIVPAPGDYDDGAIGGMIGRGT